MSIDWKYILSISSDDLKEDDKERLFTMVTWCDAEKSDEDDGEEMTVERVKKLFKISQELLKYKGEQVETLLHELDEVAIKLGEEEAAKKLDARTSTKKSTAFEIESLEQRYNELKSKCKKLQKINEKNVGELENLRGKLKIMADEKNQLEKDLNAVKHDGSDSSEISETIKDQHRELVETVHNKNKQLSNLLRDIEEIDRENTVLREKVSNLKDELAVATSELQKQTDQLQAKEFKLHETENLVKKLNIDNELLQENIEELTTQKVRIEENFNEFTTEIDKRIEEWQRISNEKDEEIRELKSGLPASKSLSRNSSFSRRSVGDQNQLHHISALQKLISERDIQLAELQSKLSIAIKDMNECAESIENLKKQKEELSRKSVNLTEQNRDLKLQLQQNYERCIKLQEQVEIDEKFTEESRLEVEIIKKQLKEDGRLDEIAILKEIQEVKAANRLNEKRIISLVKHNNKLQEILDESLKENTYFREKLGIYDEEMLNLPSNINSSYDTKTKSHDKKELGRLKRKLLKFEEENLNLRSEIKSLKRIKETLEIELNEMSHEKKIINENEHSLSIGEVKSLKMDERLMLQEEIRNVCEENEALRRGMHEILHSLNAKKESCEIKSETFEKLLRALDVKHISGWYHPAMRLQAEVHSIEGINIELREQLRKTKIELEEVRSEKEDLLILSKRSSVSSPRHLAQSNAIKDVKILEQLNENVNVLIERTTIDANICGDVARKMGEFAKNFESAENQMKELFNKLVQEKKDGAKVLEILRNEKRELEVNFSALEEKLKLFNESENIRDPIKKLAELTEENVRVCLKIAHLENENKTLSGVIQKLKTEMSELEILHVKNCSDWMKSERDLKRRIEVLQGNLENSICYEDHVKVKKNLENATVKLREAMENFKRQSELNQNQLELAEKSKKLLEEEKNELKSKLFECLKNPGSSENSSALLQNSELEVNLISERQRANHVNNLYELVKEQLHKSEARFGEYEIYTKDILVKNANLQNHIQNLEEKLRNSIEFQLHNAVKTQLENAKKKLHELEVQLANYADEKLRAEMKSKATTLWNTLKEEELLALKHQAVDLLAESDDKATIGRISAELIQVRMSELELKNKLETLGQKLEQIQVEKEDCHKRLDEFRDRSEAREAHLRKKLRILVEILEYKKLQYSGCIPLICHEKFVENLKLTLENNHASFVSLYNAQTIENESLVKREQAEIELKHYTENCRGNVEEKLQNWLEEKRNIEIELIRFKRQAEFKEILLKQCNERVEIQNSQIAKLEEDLFLSHQNLDYAKTIPDFSYTKPAERSALSMIKLNKTRDVQTEEITTPILPKEGDEKLRESLKTELINTRNELEKREETIRDLKNKLNETEMNLSLFRKQIGDKQAQINFYEKHIIELQSKGGNNNNSLEEPKNVKDEEVISLKASIKALQETIALKDENLLKYQSLLKEDRDNHSMAAVRMQEEVKMLKNALAEEKQKRSMLEEQSSEFQRSKTAIENYVKQVHNLEQHTDELHTQVTALEAQLQSSRQEAVRFRSLANDRLKAMDEMREELEEQHKNEIDVYKKDSEKWREEVLSLKDLINKHKNEILQMQPDLQIILQTKDDKISDLTQMVHELKDELETRIEKENRSDLSELENLRKEHANLRKRHEILLNKERKVKEEIRELKGQIVLNKRPATAATTKGDRNVKEQLQRKVASLEEEIVKLKEELATQTAFNETHKLKIAEDFDRWKKHKQSQQIIEKLKTKLKEREGDIEKIQNSCTNHRTLIERLEREKLNLESRLKAMKSNLTFYGNDSYQQNAELLNENMKLNNEIRELKAKLEMQQRHSGGLGAVMMQEKLEAQERKLAIMELSGRGPAEVRAEMERLQCAISNLQKSNLFLEAKNIELKLDLEKCQKDFPRFKEQIQHLESYIAVLKAEGEKHRAAAQTGAVSKVSETEAKRVRELERTIVVLKRVVEKLQNENKRLINSNNNYSNGKFSPPGNKSFSGTDKLRRDFVCLKGQYEESLKRISELESVIKSKETEQIQAKQLEKVNLELEQKTQLLNKVKMLLHSAANKEKMLLKEIAELKGKNNDGDQEK